MSDQHEAGPLWSDMRLEDYANKHFHSSFHLEGLLGMVKVRNDLQARIAALTAERDELQRRLAEAWLPVEDGLLPEEDKMLTRVMNDGRRIVQADSILTTRISGSVFLPNGYRLCRRTSEASIALESVLRDVVEWQHKQFPHRTAHSIATHLLEEAQELHRQPNDIEEMADVLMLLAGLANLNGRDLAKAVQAKLEVNKQRAWGKPNGDGVVKHVAASEESDAEEVEDETK